MMLCARDAIALTLRRVLLSPVTHVGEIEGRVRGDEIMEVEREWLDLVDSKRVTRDCVKTARWEL